MLDWSNDAVNNSTIHFAFSTGQLKFSLLAKLLAGLTNDSTHTRRKPEERHHAGTHQPFLKFCIDP